MVGQSARQLLTETHTDGRYKLTESYKHAQYDSNGVLERALVLSESTTGGLPTLKVIAAKADVINANIRFYSQKVFELAVGRAQKLIESTQFLGQVDHPGWEGTLQEAAFRYTKLYMEGAFMVGEGVIMPTPTGKLLSALIAGGVIPKVSTRGYGSVTFETRVIDGVDVEVALIGDDYTMEGIDFVLFQSNPFGTVSTESTAPQEKRTMTVETLRTQHPELVAQIEAKAREGFVSAADVATQVAAAKVEGTNEGKTATLASAEIVSALAAVAVLAKVQDSLGTNAKPPVTEKTETEKQLEAIQTELATARGLLEESKAEKTRNEAALAEAKLTGAITARVTEALVDAALAPYADILRPELLACKTLEAVEAVLTSKRAFIESVRAKVAAPGSGQGVSGANGDRTDDVPDAKALEEKNIQRRAAGLAPLTA